MSNINIFQVSDKKQFCFWKSISGSFKGMRNPKDESQPNHIYNSKQHLEQKMPSRFCDFDALQATLKFSLFHTSSKHFSLSSIILLFLYTHNDQNRAGTMIPHNTLPILQVKLNKIRC